MPELGYQPTNRYLPPRPRRTQAADADAPQVLEPAEPRGLLGWLDRMLAD
jgi:sulfite dehydrogenase (quinone) subunit SoeB